jgi:hypothetical protein
MVELARRNFEVLKSACLSPRMHLNHNFFLLSADPSVDARQNS